ncbi:SulP family inorganic anion transporter [Campylobacter hyointestinalis subsp. lawsonii]|nr:SulP family inorganic anion transporter [Campylobacter hyointestinalis subsp. lawsonii]
MLNIKGDIAGGLTAGVIALPLCLAFGIASGLGAAAGLYGAILLSFFAAIFGGTKTQISGPTGPMTVVTASVVVALGGDMSLLIMVFVLAGFFQILLGVFKIGRFIRFIPYPVISGFMNGVGVIIILLQISPLLGGLNPNGTIEALIALPSIDINPQSLMLGALALIVIYLTPKKISAFIPSPLLALILFSLLSYFLNLDVKTIGLIPSSLPTFIIPQISYSHITIILTYALVLATLGSIDSLLTSLVADSLTKTKHSSNRELIGQGIGNMMAGFFGGLVGAGATMRTVTNIKLGGNSRLSGVTSSVFLALVLLSFSDFVSYVPIPVLSAILIKVGFDIFDYRLLKELKTAPKCDLSVMILVFLLTVFVDLIFAVGVGVLVASLVLVYQVNKAVKVDYKKDEDLTIVSIYGAFFFGSSSKIANALSHLASKKTIINIKEMPFVDLSGIYALEDEINMQLKKGYDIYIVTNKDQNLYSLINLVGKDRIFDCLNDAIKTAKN